MQALQSVLQGSPTHKTAQHQTNRGKLKEPSASAPKPRSARHRLFQWAMSALGLHTPAAAAAAAAAQPVATAPAPIPPADAPGRLRLAIVGDVHGAWRGEREEAALRLLGPDLTLLVGDFGNEDVALVTRVAALGLPKAVILGNHDAWFTMTGRSGGVARRGAVQQTLSAADLLADMRARGGGGDGSGGAAAAAVGASPAGGPAQDGVRQQLAALGSCHVGYGSMPLDERGYTVMGARPFSKGGKNFTSIRGFMEGLYGVTSMEESAARIVQVAQSAPAHHALVVVGHNGPAGLGGRAFDICGVDWEAKAGDHGDPDLQAALAALHRSGRHVALVTFGHMHHTLHHAQNRGRASRHRRMVALDPKTGTVFLNAATVPRVVPAPVAASGGPAAAAPPPPSRTAVTPKSFGSGRRARMAAKAAAAAAAAAAASSVTVAAPPGPGSSYGGGAATQHHFMVAELERGEVVSARDVWVQVTPVTEDTAAAVLEAAAEAAAAAASASASASSRSEAASDGCDSGTDSESVGGEDDGGDGGGGIAEASAAAALTPRRIGDFVVQVVRDHVLLRTVAGANRGVVKFIWNAYDQMYEPYILHGGAAAAAARRASGDEGGDDNGEQAVVAAAADGATEGSTAATAAAAAATPMPSKHLSMTGIAS